MELDKIIRIDERMKRELITRSRRETIMIFNHTDSEYRKEIDAGFLDFIDVYRLTIYNKCYSYVSEGPIRFQIPELEKEDFFNELAYKLAVDLLKIELELGTPLGRQMHPEEFEYWLHYINKRIEDFHNSTLEEKV